MTRVVHYMVNPSGPAVRAAQADCRIGCIVTPAEGKLPPRGSVYLIDNSCGPDGKGQAGTKYPGDGAYLAWLLRIAGHEDADPCDPDTSGCYFAVAPDVVGDASATLARAETSRMLAWIRYAGFPAAFVAQNGQEHLPVPWDDLDCLFLGGSPECLPCGYVLPVSERAEACAYCGRRLTEWKLGTAARALAAEAKRRGKWVHMGRVNSLRRLLYAYAIGCDSADGTCLTRDPGRYLPVVIGWQREANHQPGLFDVMAATA